jgi:nicotinate-nucleotide adenylyltransferase
MNAATGTPLGFLGGTFDPVHAGHLQLARDARAALGLESVTWIPAGQPWQKGTISASPARLAMLHLALQGHPEWRIDTREIERGGPSYTIDTLQALRREWGPARPLVWILGFDQIARLDSWHRWEELLDWCHLAFAHRAGSDAAPAAPLRAYLAEHALAPAALAASAHGGVAEFAMHPVDCSATALRASLAADDHQLAHDCLPAGVHDYIRSHHLYQAAHGS